MSKLKIKDRLAHITAEGLFLSFEFVLFVVFGLILSPTSRPSKPATRPHPRKSRMRPVGTKSLNQGRFDFLPGFFYFRGKRRWFRNCRNSFPGKVKIAPTAGTEMNIAAVWKGAQRS